VPAVAHTFEHDAVVADYAVNVHLQAGCFGELAFACPLEVAKASAPDAETPRDAVVLGQRRSSSLLRVGEFFGSVFRETMD
jgi:hypothetical protein